MEIRSYQKGDEKEIWELDRKLEEHPWNKRELSNWYWKYTDSNPSGKSFIWLMEKDGSIIAHFAAVPYKIKVFDREIVASHSIAALVKEEYQNLGLLKFVGDKLFKELKENEIPFTYGFPNKRAYGLHKEFMQYHDLIFFETWKIEKNKITNKEQLEFFRPIDKFDDDFDKLWDDCCDDYKVAVVRNKKYLNWRYLKRPDWKYYPFGIYQNEELKGYVVLKLYKEDKIIRGHILDVFTHLGDTDTLNKIIDGSLDFFKEHNVDEITCFMSGNTPFEKALKEHGFFKEKTKIPLIIRINKEFDYSEEIKDQKNWYFMMGDSTEVF